MDSETMGISAQRGNTVCSQFYMDSETHHTQSNIYFLLPGTYHLYFYIESSEYVAYIRNKELTQSM